jgi:hypothetical protein
MSADNDCYVIGRLDFWCMKLAAWIRGDDTGKIKRFRPKTNAEGHSRHKAFVLAIMRDRKRPQTHPDQLTL